MKDLIFYSAIVVASFYLIHYFLRTLEYKQLKEERKVLNILCGVVELNKDQVWGLETIPSYNELLLKDVNALSSKQVRGLSEHLRNYYQKQLSTLESASKILLEIKEMISNVESQKELIIIIELCLAEIPREQLLTMYEKYLSSYLFETKNIPYKEDIVNNMSEVFKLLNNTMDRKNKLSFRNESVTMIYRLLEPINDGAIIIAMEAEKRKMLSWLPC
ncbi:MAG: hypothetical protein WCK37_02970 [Candidatus Falkowbacteria bacterium]